MLSLNIGYSEKHYGTSHFVQRVFCRGRFVLSFVRGSTAVISGCTSLGASIGGSDAITNTYVEGEATPLWDQGGSKPHVIAVDEGACVAMGVHHREVHSLAGGWRLSLQILRQTLVGLD